MGDPLSVVSGVAGIISLGIQVTGSLVKFYASYKDQDTDVARTTERLESLLDTFRFLDTMLQNGKFQPDEQDLIEKIESSIQKCDDIIKELQDECRKFETLPKGGIKGAIRGAGRRAAYPFRESTLKKLDEDIGEMRDNISLALEIVQLKDHRTTHDNVTEIKSLLELIKATQISSTICDWLKAPDAAVNHNNACAKHHVGTGTWFVGGSVFNTWLIHDSSFLWLNGFAGSGKSVLCSTAIQNTFRKKRHDPDVGIAFFYFTFNDEYKQDESAMLRTLLLQLSAQLQGDHTELARLHASDRSSVPPATVLVEYLRHLIQKFHQVYILLDALDECPRFAQRSLIRNARKNVLDTIREMRKWSLPGLHVLVTSRDEPDIRRSLKPMPDQEVIMDNSMIDQDIRNFISYRLKTEFQDWDEHHGQIEQALAERAHGVFRWVECQFEVLEQCPQSEYHLVQCLESLPEGLDETYERMLCFINKQLVEEARRVLTILCFSTRPLSVTELIDVIAVDLRDPARLDRRRRLRSADDIRKICPGLIDINSLNGKKGSEIQIEQTVRIAHFSVHEYLESNRIIEQKAATFALNRSAGHAEIARICLIYLLEPGLSSEILNKMKLDEFPLAHFAALFWHHHYRIVTDAASQLDGLVLELFNQVKGAFCTWVKLHDIDTPWDTDVKFQRTSGAIASPVYYASLLGLDQVLIWLITEIRNDSERTNFVNAQGGFYGNALQAASQGDHEKIMQVLLNNNANVNA